MFTPNLLTRQQVNNPSFTTNIKENGKMGPVHRQAALLAVIFSRDKNTCYFDFLYVF